MTKIGKEIFTDRIIPYGDYTMTCITDKDIPNTSLHRTTYELKGEEGTFYIDFIFGLNSRVRDCYIRENKDATPLWSLLNLTHPSKYDNKTIIEIKYGINIVE